MSSSTIDLITIYNRIKPATAESHSTLYFVTRPPMQRKSCWSVEDKTDMIDTIVRGWICPPLYTIQHPELDEQCSSGEEHMFDGAHKVEAGCEFIDGVFNIKYRTKDLPHGILKEYQGMYFKDLPKDIQLKIKTYKFHVNVIDEETAKDPDALKILWQRLNRSGKPLNDYELGIPVISSLIENVLKPTRDNFTNTVVFPHAASRRGDLEQLQQLMLAISEPGCDKIKSMSDAVRSWQSAELGNNMETREARVRERGEEWRNTLVRIQKMLGDLCELNTFRKDDGTSIMQKSYITTELPITLGLLARYYPRLEDFRSQKQRIAECLKREIFSKDVETLMRSCGCNTTFRAGSYLTRYIQYAKSFITQIAGTTQPRQFTPQQIKAALKKQQDTCTWCRKPILPDHAREGDHVIPWSQGGETTAENLEVLHRPCHQQKTAGMERPPAV